MTTKRKSTESGQGDLSAEFKALGKNLELNIKAAWKSKQRKKLEGEIGRGLTRLVRGIDGLVKKAKGKGFNQKMKAGLYAAVKKANSGLEKTHKKWEPEEKNK